MPRNSGDNDLYLPLFAGTELARRSGNLTRFPPGNILGNLPSKGLRVRRYAAEQSGLPNCQLPSGNLMTFLFYSDFGIITRPEASNWYWDIATNADWAGHPIFPSGPANSGQIVPVDVSPGTPGNNIHMRQTGVYGDTNYSWLQGLIPLQAGFCKDILHRFAVRMYNNTNFNGTSIDVRMLFAQASIHDENLSGGGGIHVDQGNTAFGVILNRSGNTLSVSDPAGVWTQNVANAFSGTIGDSIYIEVYQTLRSNGSANIRVDIGGVTKINLDYTANYYPRSMGGWGVLYPYVQFQDAAAATSTGCVSQPGGGFLCPTGNTHELYTNTWALDIA
jgi:hypothetical protein